MNGLTGTVVVFRTADGMRYLRGLPGIPTDTDLVNAAIALGAVSWQTLGTVEGPAETKVTDVDYAADGTKVRSVTRTLGDCE